MLRQIKRRTIAKLRGQVAPVPRQVLGRFLPAWHRIADSDPHKRLEDAIVQLEGMPLSYRNLVRMILPARVRSFRAEQLDELGAMGWLVWVGHSPLRGDDGASSCIAGSAWTVCSSCRTRTAPSHPSSSSTTVTAPSWTI